MFRDLFTGSRCARVLGEMLRYPAVVAVRWFLFLYSRSSHRPLKSRYSSAAHVEVLVGHTSRSNYRPRGLLRVAACGCSLDGECETCIW